jgi:hypothetical protein
MPEVRVCLAVLCCLVATGPAWSQEPVDLIFADGFEEVPSECPVPTRTC